MKQPELPRPMARRVLTACCLLASAAGCVYFPSTSTLYDEKCQTYERHMTLEVQQLGTLMGCHGEACVGALVVMGAVSASTAVVSGSVVIMGNVVYWVEKQGRCMGRTKKPDERPVPGISDRLHRQYRAGNRKQDFLGDAAEEKLSYRCTFAQADDEHSDLQ